MVSNHFLIRKQYQSQKTCAINDLLLITQKKKGASKDRKFFRSNYKRTKNLLKERKITNYN